MGDASSLAEWIDPASSALLVVDMQNDFCHPQGAFAMRGLDISSAQEIIPVLRRLMDAAREAGVLVVIIRVVRGANTGWPAFERLTRYNYGPGFIPVFVEGTWGAELLEEFRPKLGDIQLDKNRYGAFTGTNLDLMLKSKGVRTIVMSGGATNVCVESTAREGFMLDYNVVVVEDACATVTKALHEGALASIRGWFGRVERAEDVVGVWKQRFSP
jgi:ureidoacrylate peracid hydrolase